MNKKTLAKEIVKALIVEANSAKKPGYTVYFDIDDTLTDYSDRLEKLKGIEVKDEKTGEMRVGGAGDTTIMKDFWTDAKWLPGSKEMIAFAVSNFDDVQILSAVPELSKAKKAETGDRFFTAPVEGKAEWLSNNGYGGLKLNWTKNGKEKANWANPNAILIDDKLENVEAFEKAGGIGILMDSPKKVVQTLKKYAK